MVFAIVSRIITPCSYHSQRLCSTLLEDKLKDALKEARDAILGDLNKCSPRKPTSPNAVDGGTLWERNKLAISLPNASRCYTLTQSIQVPKSLVGPTASAKLHVVPKNLETNAPEQIVKVDHHDLRQKIVKVCYHYFVPVRSCFVDAHVGCCTCSDDYLTRRT